MRISDWSSDVCSSDLERIDADIALSDDRVERVRRRPLLVVFPHLPRAVGDGPIALVAPRKPEFLAEPEQPGGGSHRVIAEPVRSEEPTSELRSLMRIPYAVFCLQKKHATVPMKTI